VRSADSQEGRAIQSASSAVCFEMAASALSFVHIFEAPESAEKLLNFSLKRKMTKVLQPNFPQSKRSGDGRTRNQNPESNYTDFN
jgi:hypothetical protein